MTSTHPAEHATFTLERRYDVPPAVVFAAWADPATKARGSPAPVPSTRSTSRSAGPR
ncbi:hypothetical protein [Sanguibacter keddieii]|uniref:hypothetical protein n=1 Tax=Sanguibacter keddieii TaxID=60920 RepID=UPI0001B8477A|nr:hypothetical protein [Sanguibacter keddieii]